ncbi:uncharacterized protein LOC118732584 [Rhagoletis pomonella]|uniref:uncharacterized protein LOC118732584 n=1 Tax=Rhagoletis pomonella TaxID=28610 RepID=UPI00177F519A|nr:uncharacterized protein LOC118732584 [Rhagoletis pomonella]
MERANQLNVNEAGFYIPHHAVMWKFRVVFNASARTTTGVSLNEVQLVGTTIQEPLLNIIYRFRRFRIALSADVEKMRESPTDDITIYRLTTVTYGTAAVPTTRSAQSTNAHTTTTRWSLIVNKSIAARDAILSSFYVDDFPTSCDTEENATELAANVTSLLSEGHFRLRKWNSSSGEILARLIGNRSSNVEMTIESPTATVLGLRWDAAGDELFFKVDLKENIGFLTKRRVLSDVAKLFDPIGILAPVIVTGKIFIQRLWAAGLSWDEPLPDELQTI